MHFALATSFKSQVTRHNTSHVTHHTSHVILHTSHVTSHTSHVTRQCAFIHTVPSKDVQTVVEDHAAATQTSHFFTARTASSCLCFILLRGSVWPNTAPTVTFFQPRKSMSTCIVEHGRDGTLAVVPLAVPGNTVMIRQKRL